MIKTIIEMTYIIYMWNYFKTKYSFHNIWEAPIMNHEDIPDFIKHSVDTGRYESKICPLGNISAFALAGWILLRDIWISKYKSKSKMKTNIKQLNLFIFTLVLILSFLMNLNAFIYYIPIFVYEFHLN